jgi:hypothetical protein
MGQWWGRLVASGIRNRQFCGGEIGGRRGGGCAKRGGRQLPVVVSFADIRIFLGVGSIRFTYEGFHEQLTASGELKELSRNSCGRGARRALDLYLDVLYGVSDGKDGSGKFDAREIEEKEAVESERSRSVPGGFVTVGGGEGENGRLLELLLSLCFENKDGSPWWV